MSTDRERETLRTVLGRVVLKFVHWYKAKWKVWAPYMRSLPTAVFTLRFKRQDGWAWRTRVTPYLQLRDTSKEMRTAVYIYASCDMQKERKKYTLDQICDGVGRLTILSFWFFFFFFFFFCCVYFAAFLRHLFVRTFMLFSYPNAASTFCKWGSFFVYFVRGEGGGGGGGGLGVCLCVYRVGWGVGRRFIFVCWQVNHHLFLVFGFLLCFVQGVSA